MSKEMLSIKYDCYYCHHQFTEVYSCACDSECPECGAEHIMASSWTEIKETNKDRILRQIEAEGEWT